jgi:ubiquinone/menaquinone biosynthesis C-methylase UbiE
MTVLNKDIAVSGKKNKNQERRPEHKEAVIPEGGNFTYGHPGGAELTRRAIRLCSLPEGAYVLDFGCGAGESLTILRDEFKLKAAGADSDKGALNACKLRDASLDVTRVINNVLDFPSLAFDAVLAECSLSVVEDGTRGEYLHEFYCVLKKGGKLVISDIFNRGDEDRIQAELENAGFKLLLWEYHSQELKNFAAQLIMDGRSASGCDRYGKDTGYYLLVAVK